MNEEKKVKKAASSSEETGGQCVTKLKADHTSLSAQVCTSYLDMILMADPSKHHSSPPVLLFCLDSIPHIDT